MNWRELITGIYETREEPGIAGQPQFHPPASAVDIVDAEARLDARFPASIRSLLSETNGVMDMMAIDGGEWFDSMWLLWTVAEIIEQNLKRRVAIADGRRRRDFSQLLFFAGAGADGILFAFPVMDDRACAPRVLVWHPLMDELDELAPSLDDFLRGWLTSTISV